MDYLLILGGVLIVMVVLHDVVLTVLVPASGSGLIRKPIEYCMWGVFRIFGRVLPAKFRERLLLYMGPLTIIATLTAWITMLVLGWALIYKPALGTYLLASSGATDTSWSVAIYYSGMTLTTLGIGDLAPSGSVYRLLTIVQAALGFATFSLVITYILSVYSNLIGWNAFAQGLHHLSRDTGDAVELLSRLSLGDDLPGVVERINAQAEMLRETYQSHRFYPVLRHFHFAESHYAVPRVVLIALETVTLIRTALDKDQYQHLIRSEAIDQLLAAAVDLAREFQGGIASSPPSPDTEDAWRARYVMAVERLQRAGLQTTDQHSDGADAYVQMRSQWHDAVRSMSDKMLYTWEEIEPPATRP